MREVDLQKDTAIVLDKYLREYKQNLFITMEASSTHITLEIKPGTTATIQLSVFTNPTFLKNGKTILAVPGIAHTGETFSNLAKTFFSKTDSPIKKIIAINMPGHGRSGLPTPKANMLFGDLSLQNYSCVLIAALQSLKESGTKVDGLLGHSMGAMIILVAQQYLLRAGSDLEEAYGIKSIALLASSIPNPLPWVFSDSGNAAQLASLYIASNPELGNHVAIPSAHWVRIFFSDHLNAVPTNAPSTESAMEAGYNTVEALTAAAQIVGIPGKIPRQWIDPGIFSDKKICTQVIAQSEDLATEQEAKNLYLHLTDDNTYKNFHFIQGADAVHDMYISNPAAVAEVLFTSALQHLK